MNRYLERPIKCPDIASGNTKAHVACGLVDAIGLRISNWASDVEDLQRSVRDFSADDALSLDTRRIAPPQLAT